VCQPHNKQLQQTVTGRRGDGASAPLHYALAPRITRQLNCGVMRSRQRFMALSSQAHRVPSSHTHRR
jgi:hypothetical protein